MTSHRRRAAAAGLFATLLTAPALATGASPGEVTVGFADLDLSSGRGVQTLRHRLVVASRLACDAVVRAQAVDPAWAEDCLAETLPGAMHSLRMALEATRSRPPALVATNAAR